MDEKVLHSRLSRISTVWTLLDDAHGMMGDDARQAQLALIQRYQGAAYRYLLGAVRDPDTADELFQEFALRFLQGALSRVTPERGRFRDYLKTVLIHLVCDHRRRQAKAARSIDPAVAEPAAAESGPEREGEFLDSWRDELLARAWADLEQAQRQGGQPYFSVLKLRLENPQASSPEMAAALTEKLRPAQPFSDTGTRKTLQRARARFAEALLDDVAHSLGNPSAEELEQEMIDLGLACYCRSALARRASRRR